MGVQGFVNQFDYWYTRVIREAVPKYQSVIVKRINAFIRRIEFEGCDADECARRLVEDYTRRNFVTAGGWALEELAVGISPDSQKSPAEGIDIQRFEPETGNYHLYVLKSGLVTRNSDIVKALKTNARSAEKLLRQGSSTGSVTANYAIAAGSTTSTFEDGIRRPSSAEFWSEMTGLPPDDALEVVLAAAAVAGSLVRKDAQAHIDALETLVRSFIEDGSGSVDWDFLCRLTMYDRKGWHEEAAVRDLRAIEALHASGYTLPPKMRRVLERATR